MITINGKININDDKENKITQGSLSSALKKQGRAKFQSIVYHICISKILQYFNLTRKGMNKRQENQTYIYSFNQAHLYTENIHT